MNQATSQSKTAVSSVAFKISAVLFVIWGLVHILAGVMTIGQPATQAVQGISDAVDPAILDVEYPDAAGALINQHGFNLLWIGCVATVAAVFVWTGSLQAVLLASLVAGLTDIGYFLFMDLGGYVNFLPGTLMTIICAAAVGLGFVGVFQRRSQSSQTNSPSPA